MFDFGILSLGDCSLPCCLVGVGQPAGRAASNALGFDVAAQEILDHWGVDWGARQSLALLMRSSEDGKIEATSLLSWPQLGGDCL